MRFMQIAGNCKFAAITGEMRVKGPVDNVGSNDSLKLIKYLFEEKYLLTLLTQEPKISKRNKDYEKDSELEYYYDFATIYHNNPRDVKYKKELLNRLKTFNEFDISKPENYYIFIIHNIISEEQFKEIVEYLEERKVLNKTIFIRCPSAGSEQLEYVENIEKFNVKYIELKGIDFYYYKEEYHQQFLAELDKLLTK